MAAVFADILATPVEDDGVVFRPETLRAVAAREEDEYAGVRLDFVAELAGARLSMHVDIGYGDVITPGPVEIEYPSLLGQPAPRLRAYPPETVVAEKFQAMVALGMLNTRMKDFFDLWAIAGAFAFDGAVLASAIRTTFAHRETPDRFVRDGNAALKQHFFDQTQAQRKAEIEPDRVCDDLGRKPVALVVDGTKVHDPRPIIQTDIAELSPLQPSLRASAQPAS
jgi:hypothetical protein